MICVGNIVAVFAWLILGPSPLLSFIPK